MTTSNAPHSVRTSGVANPADTEMLGKQLAVAMEALGIGIVACWYRVEDAVLAHVVAQELRVPVTYAFESEGLLSLSDPVNGTGVALIAIDFPHANDLPGLSGVVRADGGDICAVGTGQVGLDLRGTAAEGAANVIAGLR